MDDAIGAFILLAVAVLFIGCGYLYGASHGKQLLENCRKTNNVYECELVAVPKEQSE
jgi:hypothetical protein